MDNRRLTFIVVPHGDLETRTFEISYGRLKALLGLGAAVVLLLIAIAATWFYLLTQVARVPSLEREVSQLQEEQRKVAELAETLAEVEAQYEKVRQMLGADAPEGSGRPSLPPLPSREDREESGIDEISSIDSWPLPMPGYLTQGLSGQAQHPGIDVAVPLDTYIRAAGPGVVRLAATDVVYGRYVVLDHGAGVESLYAHASQLLVETGDTVESREVIALSGSTGRSSAPHLHFEVRRDGEAVDPLSVVRQR